MRVRLLAAAAALLLTAGLSACSGSAASQGVTGPPLPERFVPVWTADVGTPSNAGGVAVSGYPMTSAAVVLPLPGGDLAARDPATGQVRWTIAPYPGWLFSGDAVIGDRLYADMTTPDRTLIRLAAYDLATGRVLWRTEVVAFLNREIGLQQVLFTSRGIVVQLGAANALYGLRLSDGRGSWLTRLPVSCQNGSAIATQRATVFLLECTGIGVRLDSVDPATGRISWQRVLSVNRAGAYPFDLGATSAAGDIVALAGTTTRIFSSAGRLIATRVPPVSCPGNCTIGASGPVGVFELGANPDLVQAVNLTTGRVQWQRAGDLIGSLNPAELPVDSAGTMFALAGSSLVAQRSALLPAFIMAMQTATGRSSLIPLPVASAGGESTLAGFDDGLLLVYVNGSQSPFVTAFRPVHVATAGPVALGGVRAGDWPDACALVKPADLRFIAAGYVSSPRAVLLSGVTWPKTVTCAYVGPGAGDPAVTLTVAWIAASAADASELVASDLAILALGPQPPAAIPGGHLVYDGTGGVDRALIAAGRAIVTVTVPGSPADARRLAPVVAARLRASYG
jgi:outer membrane protein assembly factor BamB